jgi:Na+/melibiose symporter-like transporter
VNALRYLLFACGQIGIMGLARFFFSYILDYARTVPDPAAAGDSSMDSLALFSGFAIGLTLLGFRLFDGITDPIAGSLSDGWVSRGRERRGLLWFSFLIPPIGLVLCFAATHTMDPTLRWALVVAGMFLFFVGYTFYAIPYWSLIADYSPDDMDRRRLLSNLLGAGLLIATAIGALVAPALITELGYRDAALAFAIPASFLMVLPFFARPTDLPQRHDDKAKQGPPPPPMFETIKAALKHRRYLAVLILFAGSQMSFTVITAGAPFIARDLLGGSLSDVPRIMGPFLGTAIPFFMFTPWISRRLGWERAVMLASVALGAVYALSAGLGEAWIGDDPMTSAMIVFGLAGPMAAIVLGLEGEAVTACVAERGTGAGEITSVYFGVFNFVVKALNGVAIAFSGLLVDMIDMPEYGTLAVRGLSIAAGGLLFLGVAGYFAIGWGAEAPVRVDADDQAVGDPVQDGFLEGGDAKGETA